MINTIICGAAGRMGRANTAVFHEDKNVKIVGAIEKKDSKYIGSDAGNVAGIDNIGIKISSNLDEVISNSDVIIDFTNVETTLNTLEILKKYKKSIVIGTTGFTENQVLEIKNYSREFPVLLSPNMSQGVNVLFYIVKEAAKLLGNSFEAEILEIHHDQKKDAPSGTAIQFGNIIAETKGKILEDIVVCGRKGLIGERNKDEIGIMSIRIADVVGEHSIIFGGPGERIEVIHKCSSRKNFASGALRAAKFIADKKNGFYSMKDVLGIK